MAQPGRKPAGDTTPEALFLHCQTVYKTMMEHAQAREDEETHSVMIVYEGILTNLVLKECNLSAPYYSSVTQALKGMGCIRQLKRGGGTAPSLWELITEPTLEVFRERKPAKPRSDRVSMLQDQVDSLTGRVTELERIFAKVITREGTIALSEEENDNA